MIRVMGYSLLNGNRTEFPYKRNIHLKTEEELEEYKRKKKEQNPGYDIAVNYMEDLPEEYKSLITPEMTDEEAFEATKHLVLGINNNSI
jgi:hypothetical protein